MKKQIVYKLVQLRGKQLWSLSNGSWFDAFDKWSVQYRPGRWRAPKRQFRESKLFAFDSLSNALAFCPAAWNRSLVEVWKAEATEVKPARPYPIGIPNSAEDVLSFWRRRYKSILDFRAFSGTVFCGRIKLVKKIEL